MFWERFNALCLERNTTPTAVVNELGLARGSVTKWKSGSSPSAKTISKIANHLDVTANALLGYSSKETDSYTEQEKNLLNLIKALTDDEVKQVGDYIDFVISKRGK